jgi:hypothetical protein
MPLIPYLLIAVLIATTVGVIALLILPRMRDRRVVFSTEPDAPKAFGFAMAWIAIRTSDTEHVARALDLAETALANWNAGIGTIYDAGLGDDYIFISPPVKGWTFVAGVPLPLPVGRAFVDKLTPLLAHLGNEFREVQYFASYPVIDFFAWARLERGRMVRAFAIGDEGVIWDRGRLTPEERALGLKLFELRGIRGRKGDTGEAIILHPTEEQVLRMACGWSLDPSTLDKAAAAQRAAGFVALAPPRWRTERIRKAA